MTMTSLWRNVSALVVMFVQTADPWLKVFINFCFQSLLTNATDCCRTERQIQQNAWDSAHNNASTR